MDEHVHEWVEHFAIEYGDKFVVKERYIAKCKHCPEHMTISEGIRRINATERVSAEMARQCVDLFGTEVSVIYKPIVKLLDSLRAYADILEGK